MHIEHPRHTLQAAILVSGLLCLASPVDARAQLSQAQGLVVGLEVGGAVVTFENQPRDRAGIVGARAGYGFNRALTPYLGIYEADVDTPGFQAPDKVTLGHVDLGVRLHLPNDRHWIPYVDPAWTLRIVQLSRENVGRDTRDFSGPGFSLGGGLAVYLSDTWALDLNLKWGKGQFRRVPVGDRTVEGPRRLDFNAESARFIVGFLWWP